MAEINKKRTKRGKGDSLLAFASASLSNPVLKEDLFEEVDEQKNRFKISERGWVHFFDEKDGFLRKLWSLVNTSPTTRAIIKNKATLAIGDGFIVNEGRLSIVASMRKQLRRLMGDETEMEELVSKIEEVNAYGESLSEVLYKGLFDFFGWGNAYFEIVENPDDEELPVQIFHVDIMNVRLMRMNKDRMIDRVAISERFKFEPNPQEDDISFLPLYPTWDGDEGTKRRTVIHLKEYAPGSVYYGLPEWIGGLLFSEIEYRIARWNISRFQNGYVPSGVVQFFGAASPQEAQGIVDDFLETFTDTGNNSKLFVQVLADKNMAANIQTFNDTSEGSFLELAKMVAQGLVTSHRYTMSLAGFATSGKLGSNEQIRREFEIVNSQVINPVQNLFLTKMVNRFKNILSRVHNVEAWKNLTLTISGSIPVSFVGDIDVNTALDLNEKREVLGYQEASDEQREEILSSQGNRTTQQEIVDPGARESAVGDPETDDE